MVRKILKSIAWLLGVAALAVAALIAINATDDELSAEARALLPLRATPPPREVNGFIDFMALTAPADAPTYETGVKRLAAMQLQGRDTLPDMGVDPRLPRCTPLQFMSCVAGKPALREIVELHGVFLQRYRAMREKPEFVDLVDPRSPEDGLPAYQGLT